MMRQIKRSRYARIVILVACLTCGCAEPDPAATNVRDQPPSSAPESTAPGAVTPPASPQTNSSPVATQNLSASNSAPILIVELVGVALPQSLPSGSAMTFGLQYHVASGALDPANNYEWVIEPPHGIAWKQQVTLERQGELNALISEWPPETGDYTTYIQQIGPTGSATIISKKLKLTYSCQ
jgi:hypothetical protein